MVTTDTLRDGTDSGHVETVSIDSNPLHNSLKPSIRQTVPISCHLMKHTLALIITNDYVRYADN